MIVRKALLVACVAALSTTPAWALPAGAPSNEGTGHAPSTTPVGPPATTPARDANPGSDERSPKAEDPGAPLQQGGRGDSQGGSGRSGRSHRCAPHRVAYVVAGTLTGHTLVLDGPGRPTYSGDVTIDVARTNRHARPDEGTTKTYALDHARVLLRLGDANGDGSVDLADVLPGSRAKVVGKVTKLAKRCDQTGFTPELTVRRLLVHPPLPPAA